MNKDEVLLKASSFIVEDLTYLNRMRNGRRKEKFMSSNFLEGLIYDAIDDVVRMNNKKLNKINRAAYITESALNVIKNKDESQLVLEHVVCKNIYFSFLKEWLLNESLATEKVYELLKNFYLTALITKKEDLILDACGLRAKMTLSGEWDLKDPFIRYHTAKIKLINNPYYLFDSVQEVNV